MPTLAKKAGGKGPEPGPVASIPRSVTGDDVLQVRQRTVEMLVHHDVPEFVPTRQFRHGILEAPLNDLFRVRTPTSEALF
jgi:hypothetical protein